MCLSLPASWLALEKRRERLVPCKMRLPSPRSAGGVSLFRRRWVWWSGTCARDVWPEPTVWLQSHLKEPQPPWWEIGVSLVYVSFFFAPYIAAGLLFNYLWRWLPLASGARGRCLHDVLSQTDVLRRPAGATPKHRYRFLGLFGDKES